MKPRYLVLAALTLTGCSLLPGPPPNWVVNRNPLEPCGTEARDAGDGPNVVARRCLLDAFQEGRGAELITTQSSVEGDPITRYIRVHENGTVEIFHDATRDRYGSGEWERLRCERLVSVEEANAGPDGGFAPDEVFVEDGCEVLPVP